MCILVHTFLCTLRISVSEIPIRILLGKNSNGYGQIVLKIRCRGRGVGRRTIHPDFIGAGTFSCKKWYGAKAGRMKSWPGEREGKGLRWRE